MQIYSNHTILAPDGEILCRASAKRTHWYIARGLASVVCEEPTIIQLNFEPKGRGCSNKAFYLDNKEDRCVNCGQQEKLTRHHIVPKCFRRFFPEKTKSHDFHDVVPLCIDCHSAYEVEASKFKGQIYKELNVKEKKRNKICGYIKTLERHRESLPIERIEYLEKSIIEEQISIEKEAFGKKVVEKLDNLQEFVVRWRKHFLETMEPKFMPDGWDVNNEVRI